MIGLIVLFVFVCLSIWKKEPAIKKAKPIELLPKTSNSNAFLTTLLILIICQTKQVTQLLLKAQRTDKRLSGRSPKLVVNVLLTSTHLLIPFALRFGSQSSLKLKMGSNFS